VTEDPKPVGSGLTIRNLPYFFHTAGFLCLTRIDLWWVFSERMFQVASSGIHRPKEVRVLFLPNIEV
jgi:hypothetical protein